MDDLIGGIIWIIIMVVGFYLKSKKNNSEKRHSTKEKTENKLEDFLKGFVDEEDDYLPAYMESQKGKMSDSSRIEPDIAKKPISISVNSGKKENKQIDIKEPNKSEKEDRYKKATETVKSDCNYHFQINGEKDIIQGIIYKEILDSPRALKPYRPICYRRK